VSGRPREDHVDLLGRVSRALADVAPVRVAEQRVADVGATPGGDDISSDTKVRV
jgi:hypothetical protein